MRFINSLDNNGGFLFKRTPYGVSGKQLVSFIDRITVLEEGASFLFDSLSQEEIQDLYNDVKDFGERLSVYIKLENLIK